MRLHDEVASIRSSVAMSSSAHISAIRVSGAGAFDAVDGLCPRELYIQEGQSLHTVFLDDEARTIADVYVCAGADDFLVLGETCTGSLAGYVRERIGRAPDVQLEDMSDTHEVVSLNGPYAWELLADIVTPEIIGLPYFGFFHEDGITCLRAGKTGEYGYDLLVARDRSAELRERIVEHGAGFDLGVASLDALDACALENWFFNVRHEGRAGLTPIELQLQWRVSSRKSYPGSTALLERRSRRAQRRAMLVSAARELDAGDAVLWGDRSIGALIRAGRSYTLGGWLGIALLEAPLAHAGIVNFVAQHGDSLIPLRTVAAPPIDNRSLYVDPQRHSYHSRETDVFPPVVSGASRASGES